MLIILIYVVMTTCGVIFMKLGGDSLHLSFKNGIDFKIGLYTLLGFVLYLISFLMWRKLLVSNNLSYIVPITTALVQITLLVSSYLVFNENLRLINIIGIIILIIGIVFTSIK